MEQKLNCVLLIDDDEPTNFLAQMILEESGRINHIKVAQGGQEALDYLSRSVQPEYSNDYPHPDLIFLDINMPAMDGWEFLERYGQIYKKDKSIVVMLTTSLFPEDKTKSEKMPEIAGFENKPLTEDKLKKVLDRYFSNASTTL